MSVVKVQSVNGNGATLVLNSVVVGNFLTTADSYFRGTSTGVAEPVLTDSNGTFSIGIAPAPRVGGAGDVGVGLFYEENCAAGTHTVTPQANTGHQTTLTEWSGMLTSGTLDVSTNAQSSGTGTSQSTGTTGTTAQSDELAMIAFCMASTGTGSSNVGLTDPVTNYTTLHIGNDDATDVAMMHDSRILTGTGAQSATFNWTFSEAGQFWQAAIVTYKAVASSVPDSIGAANITSSAGRFIGWTA